MTRDPMDYQIHAGRRPSVHTYLVNAPPHVVYTSEIQDPTVIQLSSHFRGKARQGLVMLNCC